MSLLQKTTILLVVDLSICTEYKPGVTSTYLNQLLEDLFVIYYKLKHRASSHRSP